MYISFQMLEFKYTTQRDVAKTWKNLLQLLAFADCFLTETVLLPHTMTRVVTYSEFKQHNNKKDLYVLLHDKGEVSVSNSNMLLKQRVNYSIRCHKIPRRGSSHCLHRFLRYERLYCARFQHPGHVERDRYASRY